jgi:hypothetical protein
VQQQEWKLKLSDVTSPVESDSELEPIIPPAHSMYSAVSRGILRLNDDGSHTCQGKWAATREHFTNNQTSAFNFRLEPHFALEAPTSNLDSDRSFPLDSEKYKGSFQFKKQGARYQTIVDQQLVLRFRRNKQGSFNVYGGGINAIGQFNLVGTLIMSGKTGGQLELYRMYPPEALAVPPPTKVESDSIPPPLPDTTESTSFPSSLPLPGTLLRRESTRMVKLPSRLEDDDPSAQLSRTMEKCSHLLMFMTQKDLELGGYFREPVDPISLKIPTYLQVITEPMDLGTVRKMLDAGDITSPEEFGRLVRLIFENAIKFNLDPMHSVHQAARSLLIHFTQRFRDVERQLQTIRRALPDEKSKKSSDDKKRKRGMEEPPKSLKRRRLDEADEMASSNANAVAEIIAVASSMNDSAVSRNEFNLLIQHIQVLQNQLVRTHTLLAELSPDDEFEPSANNNTTRRGSSPPTVDKPLATSSTGSSSVGPNQAIEKKKSVKKKQAAVELVVPSAPPVAEAAPVVVVDECLPLTLEEQELLTKTINELPPEHLGGVIQIIREAAPVGADEDEIDLEIDQLDAVTQRKLLKHVSKVR